MAQHQPPMPQQAYSPPQHSPSPTGSQSGYSLPAAPAPPERRTPTYSKSPAPLPPHILSPHAQSPRPQYASVPSPNAGGTPPLGAGSPTYVQTPPAPGAYNTPYTNGHNTPTLNLPDGRSAPSPTYSNNQPIPLPSPQYTNTTLQPHGVMGPPQRPAERPTKDYEYDVTDSLAGTGIDLRAEEQYMSELYAGALEANGEARTGFAVHPAGDKSSLYGAGEANQPGEDAQNQAQKEYEAKAAEHAWQEASLRLAAQRTQEMNDAFLLVGAMHKRADRIAREHHIGLNLELRNASMIVGKLRYAAQFPQPTVTVRTATSEDSTVVETAGSFIPHDAYLVDQFALLSIATKQRLRELIEDANNVAVNRQQNSHGEVPEDWAPAAAPMNTEPLDPLTEQSQEAAATSGALKRPSSAVNGTSTAPSKMPKIASYLTVTMREAARQEREWEEARLRRRQKRRDGIVDTGSPSTPGTPGSVAPDGEKAPTKKELKKSQALKAAEANSHANQNMTSSMFAGLGGRSGLFGKKKAKSYSWMSAGQGSGTSTPTKGGGGGGGGGPGAAPVAALTSEGRNRLGTWREDKERGKDIQLRDWVAVLERDGREHKALQHAYLHLDSSK